jgi:biopolymer transport protein ExbD
MLETASPLKQSMLGSALGGTSMLRPKNGGGHRRTMVASLMLTSLVDAFSILVIFLIMNHSANNEVINVGDKLVLPSAKESELIQQGVVVRVENGKFLVDEKPVALGNLVATLKHLNSSVDVARREGIVIVADRQMDYADLSPVILAGSQSGFTKFKFAVIRK